METEKKKRMRQVYVLLNRNYLNKITRVIMWHMRNYGFKIHFNNKSVEWSAQIECEKWAVKSSVLIFTFIGE